MAYTLKYYFEKVINKVKNVKRVKVSKPAIRKETARALRYVEYVVGHNFDGPLVERHYL